MTMPVFTYEQLYRAWLDCRKNKRSRPDALLFETNAEENLKQLLGQLQERSYHPSPSIRFASYKPKLREIYAADFRDRVVHHLLVGYLEPIWEPVFIHDSFASRWGKGIHLAAQRVRSFTRKATRNGSRPAFYLQLDIRSFFMRIDREILYSLVAARCPDPNMAWLARVLILHDPTREYLLKSSRQMMARIPVGKTLGGAGENTGLPIGNLTSQFFANVYLDGLDQFVKHELKCRYYARYVDDLVLMGPDRNQLAQWHARIAEWLARERSLELNENRTRKRPVSNGIDFLGYVIRPDYVLCRRRVVNNLKTRLRDFEKQLIVSGDGILTVRYDTEILDALHACLNSYFAHFKHADTYRLRKRIFERFPFLHHYASIEKDGRLTRLNEPPAVVSSLKRQYLFFLKRYDRFILFFQVGCFYEFYGSQASKAASLLGLSFIHPKFGFRRRCGIGLRALNRYARIVLNHGRSVVVVNQTEHMKTGVWERRISAIYFPRITQVGEI